MSGIRLAHAVPVVLLILLVMASRKFWQKQPYLLSWDPPRTFTFGTISLGFVSGDHLVSIHGDEQVRSWTLGSKSATHTSELKPFLSNGTFTVLPVISPNGKWAAAQGIRDDSSYLSNRTGAKITGFVENENPCRQLFIWDLETGNARTCLTLDGSYLNPSIAFSSDGHLLAIGGKIWDFVPDPKYKNVPIQIARGCVEVWDWRNSRRIWKIKTSSLITGLSWSNKGQLAAVGGFADIQRTPGSSVIRVNYIGGEVIVWASIPGRALMRRHLNISPDAVALSGDAKRVVVSNKSKGATVFTTLTGALIFSLQCPREGEEGGWYKGAPPLDKLAISGDSRFVAGMEFHKQVQVWDLASGNFIGNYNTRKWRSSQSQPTDDSFALSANGNWLAIGSSTTREIAVYPLPGT